MRNKSAYITFKNKVIEKNTVQKRKMFQFELTNPMQSFYNKGSLNGGDRSGSCRDLKGATLS
ncbi:hypothetical protein [uncultured Ruminococcus sp.]|uniref:hypothetical protein n=1 Tax=uncultured Ruminococcus sp. TaxID=165186 RepID=UPI0026DACDE9|nr:hypothetical protein [uncultured Ruminococcus sp.]